MCFSTDQRYWVSFHMFINHLYSSCRRTIYLSPLLCVPMCTYMYACVFEDSLPVHSPGWPQLLILCFNLQHDNMSSYPVSLTIFYFACWFFCCHWVIDLDSNPLLRIINKYCLLLYGCHFTFQFFIEAKNIFFYVSQGLSL